MSKKINPVLSHSISQLRFPLAMLVVFGHANILSFPINGASSDFDVIQYPIILFSKIIFDPAVPLFFLISGLLFFWNIDALDRNEYKRKIKKRIMTLLLPYFVWNLIYDIPETGNYLLQSIGGGNWIWPIKSVVNLWFWTSQTDRLPEFAMTTPIDPPLWFVRDLFVCMLCSLLLYRVLKNKKSCIIFLSIMLLWWLSDKYQYLFPGVSVPSFLYFGIGSAIGIYKIDVMKVIQKYSKTILLVFSILFIARITSSHYVWNGEKLMLADNELLASLYILFAIPTYILIASVMIKSKYLNIEKLAAASFTLFAFHWMVLDIFRRIFKHTTQGFVGQGNMMLIQLVLYIIPCIVSLILYGIIKRNDKAKLLLSGGR